MIRMWLFFVLVFLALPGAWAQNGNISGRVAMADEGQLPDRVTIQRECGGAPQVAAYADRKGQFSFRLGGTDPFSGDSSLPMSRGGGIRGGMPDDASPSTRAMRDETGDNLRGCTLRATAPGYRSDALRLDMSRANFGTYDVGTLVLHAVEGAPGTSVSTTALRAPSAAKKAFDKGMESFGKGKTEDAEKNFEKAVGIYPQYADAWLNLGKLRLQRKDQDSASEAFQKAVEADDKVAEAHVYLGMLDVAKKQWPDAAKQLDAALQLDPVHFPDAWFNDGVANYNLKNYEGAEKSVREAMKLDPQRKNPQIDYLLGLVLAARKDFSGAADALRAYITFSPNAPDVARAKGQLAEIEKLAASGQQNK